MSLSKAEAQAVQDETAAPYLVEKTTPEPLHDKVTITLHTLQAHGLMKGRTAAGKKPVVIGLFGFASRVKELFDAAKNDNPYADWWLIRIEEKIINCRLVIDVLNEQIKERLDSLEGITIKFDDFKPTTTELTFLSQYGYLVAQIITQYDVATRSVLSLRKIGQLDEMTQTQHRQCGRQIRSLLGLCHQYKTVKVTRADVIDRTDKAIQAEKLLGALPRDVLTCEKLPVFGPIHPDEDSD